MGSEAKLRGRFGEDRVARGPGKGGDRLGQGRIGLAAADDEAAGRVAQVPRHHVDHGR